MNWESWTTAGIAPSNLGEYSVDSCDNQNSPWASGVRQVTLIAGALIFFGGLLIFANWACLIATLVTNKFHSMVPPLGGVLAALGLALLPEFRPYSFLGLLADCGFWAIIFAAPGLLGQFLRTAWWRRVGKISGQEGGISFSFYLYQGGHYVVEVSRALPPGTSGWRGRGSSGRWKTVDNGILLTSHLDTEDTPAQLLFSSMGRDFLVAEVRQSAKEECPEFPKKGALFFGEGMTV